MSRSVTLFGSGHMKEGVVGKNVWRMGEMRNVYKILAGSVDEELEESYYNA